MSEGKEKPKWKTLESNPDVINQFIHSLGVPKNWKFADCFGLDESSLSFVPRPCIAVMLLFPSSQLKDEKKKQQEKIDKEGQIVSPKLYFVKQLVANACGTIAVVHSIANNRQKVQLEKKALQKFIDSTIDKTPLERGELLGYDDEIAQAHESSSNKGQTRHDQVMPSDFHFISFVEVDGHLYELDGGKSFPIDHGITTSETFLQDAAKVIQSNFISKIQNDPYFSILTLGPSQYEETTNDTQSKEVSEEAVTSVMSMGFTREQAMNALLVYPNNVEQAVNYLLESMQ